MSRRTYMENKISIRAPARGATIMVHVIEEVLGISIRAPARGATLPKCALICLRIFQSALPRGERLEVSSEYLRTGEISIRAPARGATMAIGV